MRSLNPLLLAILVVGNFSIADAGQVPMAKRAVSSNLLNNITKTKASPPPPGLKIKTKMKSASVECEPLSKNCRITLENTPIGETIEFQTGRTNNGTINGYYQMGTISFSGSGDVSITSDTCSGIQLWTECSYKFHFTPTVVGKQTIVVSIPFEWWIWNDDASAYVSTGSSVVTDTYFARSVLETPEKECEECGSLIRVDTQTVVETIPIIGSDFTLSYNSGFTPQYTSVYNTLGKKAYFNPHGLTVSIHHYYDAVQGVLYRGSGATENVVPKTLGSGNLLVVSGDGSEVYEFDSSGKHLNTRTGLTGATKYTFNYSLGDRLASIVDGFSNTTTFTRDVNDDLTEVVAPYGQVTEVGLTGAGLIETVENPNGEIYSLTYKSGTELVETFQKPGGQTSTFTYDGNGRITKDLGHGGNFLELSKSSGIITVESKMGRQKTVEITKALDNPYIRTETLPDGSEVGFRQFFGGEIQEYRIGYEARTTTKVQDERFGPYLKRPSVVTTEMGVALNTSTETYSRSVAGSLADFWDFTTLTDTISVSGRIQTKVYDAALKTWTSTSDEGAVATMEINAQEQPVGFKVGNDTAWTFGYNASGRLNSMAQGTRKTQTISYNAAGYVESIENVRNEETDFLYDLAGRVTQITLPDSRVITYSYDANGNITGITPPGKPQHGFSLNSFGLLDTYQPPSLGLGITKDTVYTYNDDKQLTQIDKPNGDTVTFTYDSVKGRLTQITTPSGNYNYAYSNVTQRRYGHKSPYGIRNVIIPYGTMVESDEQQRASDNFLFGKVSFTRDTDHRVTSRSVRGNAATPVSTINYAYNGDNQLTQIGDLSLTYAYPSGRLSGTNIGTISDSFTYDAYGDLETYTAIYTPSGGGSATTLYTYTLTRDSGGRIAEKSETIQGTTTNYEYDYDAAGRLTEERVNAVANTTFTYDSNSNRTGGRVDNVNFSATYDDQDRMLTYNSRSYTHDNNGDLTHIQWNVSQQSAFSYDVMGNLASATLPNGDDISYTIDGFDRRIVKKVNSSFKFRYIYEDQYRIAALLNGTNVVAKEFVYATHRNVPDYMTYGGYSYRIIKDHLGSPRLVVRTDDGTVAQRMDYNVIGQVTSDSNAGFQPFGFAGGIYDPSTQLVRFGARDYDPRATGRWTTKDPIRFNGGDTNLYGYVLNDPVNFVDPKGLLFEDAIQDRSTPNQQMGLGMGLAVAGTVCMKSGAANLNLPLFLLGVALGTEGAKNMSRAHDRGAPELPDFNLP